MRPFRSFVLAALALLSAGLVSVPVVPSSPDDLAAWVDPTIGAYPPGFTNPGPVLPHGMVGLGPDTEGPLNYGGYYAHNVLVTGFSHTHMSAGVYQAGQFPMLPMVGEVTAGDLADMGYPHPVPAYASVASVATQQAEPGYYAINLTRYGIDAELTATMRTGMHRYTFPAGQAARVVVHPGRDLKGIHPATVEVVDADTLAMSVTTSGPTHTVYAVADFDRPFTAVTTLDGASVPVGSSVAADGLGIVLDFAGDGVLQARVGLSYTDLAGAAANLRAEAPAWDFDGTAAAARAAWNEALSTIEVEGGTPADLTSFYTALFHAQLFPNVLSDVDGRYPGADGVIRRDRKRPHYQQFSLWDSYRGQNQLLAVIDPDAYGDMIRSLLDFADQSGSLPRWQLANAAPNYMSGDPAIPFIAEGWCRGLVDHRPTAAALLDAMVDLTTRRGDYETLGYLPTPQPADPVELVEGGNRNAGTTLEYGVADAALAVLADAAGASTLATDRTASAGRWANLLDPETGWIRARTAEGEWIEPFLPENGYGFQEGTSWQYSWLVMHDYARLVEAMGGTETVDQRLDVFFNFPASGTTPVLWPKVQNQATAFGIAYYGNQYAPGNEHDLEAPFVYNVIGQPWKTQAVARAAASVFTPTYDGLPGNDDLGALSGWLVWTMAGAYPLVPGAPVYTLASPVFDRVVIHGGDGDLVIEAPRTLPTDRFVTDPALGGEPLERTWFTESEWREGGALTMTVGSVPDLDWGTGPDAAPPSLSTHALADFGCDSAVRLKD